MEYTDVNPKLPEWAAWKVARVTGLASPQDIEDMTQEAALTIWRTAGRAESEGYLYNAGRNSALSWWRYFVAQNKCHKTPEPGDPPDMAHQVELDAPTPGGGCLGDIIVDEPGGGDPNALVAKHKEALRGLLLAHRWRKASVEKAIQIAELIVDGGYSAENAADRMGINVATVYDWRRKLINALREVPCLTCT